MSYQVLARKWRPGKFSELVGQEHVVSAISNALDNNRLHHAYLFTGTRGVGKTTIARIFSKSLNCEEGQGANPCGQCNTCKEIEQGNYVDLLEIDAASRTKVEDTREVLDNVQYKPTRGRYKVYLIDEVHMLSKHSFNALLKTLEEPPPHVKFLLATTDPQKLPITILSRCLQFNLKAMSREQIVGQLTHILEQETLPFEPQALSLLARAAQGSMRDALSLTDQAIAQGGNKVVASVVTDMLGLMDKNQLLKVVHAVVSKSAADVMQLVNEIAEQAPDYDNVHGELASLLHQIALTQWVPEACKLETTSAKAIYQLAKTIPAEQVQLLYQIALQGRKDLPFAIDGKSAFEMTLMRMMTFAPSAPIADIEVEITDGHSEHKLPVNAEPAADSITHNPSGGPGNVSKQKETPPSDTSAPSDNTNIHADIDSSSQASGQQSNPPAANAAEVALQQPENSVTDTGTGTDADTHLNSDEKTTASPSGIAPSSQADVDVEFSEQSGSANSQATFSQATLHSSDAPPLDAYMDDMPPPSDDDGFYGAPSQDEYVNPSEHLTPSESATPSNALSAEEQLTSTADLLALRQKLKARKAQDAEDKASGTAKGDKSQSALDIQSRFVKPAANTVLEHAALDNNSHEPENSPERENSLERENSPEQKNTLAPESPSQQNEHSYSESASKTENGFSHPTSDNGVDSTAQHSLHSTQPRETFENTLAPTEQNAEQRSAQGNAEITSASEEPQDFTFDEFEEDMPFANDAPLQADKHTERSNETPAEISHAQPDSPPWALDGEPVGVSNNNQLSTGGEQPTNTEPLASDTHDNSVTPRDFDAPLNAEYQGNLTAYLDDGSKLIHASQIDQWSNLVEQMPVAGLLKQLVLHAAFSRHSDAVALEIDNSQAHLLNEGTRQQLIDALHHGLGEHVTVNITLGQPTSTPFALQQEIHAMRHAHAHSVINTDETIQTLLSTFEASVLTDTVKAR